MKPMPTALLLFVVGASRSNAAFVPLQRAPLTLKTIPSTTAENTRLCMSKNAERARVEKNLEDLMDNDWRVFRAKLVMQEAQEAQEKYEANRAYTPAFEDATLAEQERNGNLFSGVFNSVFSGARPNEHMIISDEIVSKGEPPSHSMPSSIFDGDAVGGATHSSVLPEGCQDPFASPAELPTLMPSQPVQLDRHRWAHPIPHIEPGCILVSNERLGGVFHQTVVLVIDHHESAGSTGIIINRPMPGKLQKVASEQPSNVNLSLQRAFSNAAVTYGGPVMQDEFSILHSYGEVEGSKRIAPGLFVGGSGELMHEVRRNIFDPKDALFVKGHAAWVPGQLDREVAKGVWYPAAVSADFILRYAGAPILENDNGDDLWSDILHCLGGAYAEIATLHAGRGDKRMMP